MRRLALVLSIAATLAPAQERPTPQARRDLTPPRDTVTAPAPLPTIDLPEYVITGLASIELPRVEKQLEDGGATGSVLVPLATPVRDRSTGPAPGADLGDRPQVGGGPGFDGALRAGIGSFRMPLILASLRTVVDPVRFGVNGHYRRSSGFAPWTAWAEGGLDGAIAVPVDLESAGLRHATLSGDLGFESRSYHWYGTPTPWHQRKIALSDGGIGLRGFVGTWSTDLTLQFGGATITDSTSSLIEGTTRLRWGGEGSVEGVPLMVSLSTMASNRSDNTAGSTNLTTVGAHSRWQPVDMVWVSGGIGLAILNGNGGQRRAVVLPTVRVQFSIDDQHRLVGAFEPRVEDMTLVSSFAQHRFIDARTPLRFASWSNAGRFGLESDWTSDVRTRVEVEAGKGTDLPMIADAPGLGMARWQYGDASFAAFRAECIAKMRGNDYFSATVTLRSSRNEAGGLAIPYWPAGEARFSYAAMVTPLLTVRGSVQIVHTRESQWSGASSTLPGYAVVDVSASYVILSSMSVWAEVTNLSNSVYQHWKGIQEPPFRLSAGIALAW